MKTKNCLKVKMIVGIYLLATVALLLLGYSVQKPKVTQQEFPFTITYSYEGKTETIADVYVGEFVRKAGYLGDDSIGWYGYIKDRNRLESDFYRIAEQNGQSVSINLNILPGYLMGDAQYADTLCQPTGEYYSFDGTNELVVTDPAELEKLGFAIVSWEYPSPIENTFSFGGISLSSEATLLTTAIAMIALLACMILIKREPEVIYGKSDKVSVVLSFLIAIVVFPFVFMFSVLSEIVADVSAVQQLIYLLPALTILTVAASVVMRRCGYGKRSLMMQLVITILFAAFLLIAQV